LEFGVEALSTMVQKDVFERIFQALAQNPDFEYALIDGTIVKVHRHGTGAKGGPKTRPPPSRLAAARCSRPWRRAKLQVLRRRPRKRIATEAAAAGACWRQPGVVVRLRVRLVRKRAAIKCLTVTDEWTREGLAIEVDGRIRSGRILRRRRGGSARRSQVTGQDFSD